MSREVRYSLSPICRLVEGACVCLMMIKLHSECAQQKTHTSWKHVDTRICSCGKGQYSIIYQFSLSPIYRLGGCVYRE